MLDQNTTTIIASFIAVVGTLGGAITGVLLSNNHTSKMERLRIKQEEKKRKRALVDELFESCFKIQKLYYAALEGVYPISEFSFEPMTDIKDRIMAIIVVDFEENLYDEMYEYFGYTRKFETAIEEFHALIIANLSLEDPLISSKREENVKIFNDLTNNTTIFLKKVKKAC